MSAIEPAAGVGSAMEQAGSQSGGRRNTGIDLFRGALVILVILGHFSELTQRDSILTWVGLGFRMPLFIGLTGYLFNLEHARTLTLRGLFRKHYRRLILPWIVACAVVLTLTGALDWLIPWSLIARPPYHLWFVPVMLAFIVVARSCRLAPATILAIALPASIAAMYLLGAGHATQRFAEWLPDRRYFIYPVYFALGMWVARQPFNPRLRIWLLAAAGVGLLWWCRLHAHPSLAGEVAAALLMCVPLIGLFPWIRAWDLPVPLIVPIGRDSLFFYLWHPMAFAVWATLGLSGLPLLVLGVVSILLVWVALARVPPLCIVLGICEREPGKPRPPTPALDAPVVGST